MVRLNPTWITRAEDWFPGIAGKSKCIDVVAQEVVPVEAGAANRRSLVQASMRAVPVVLVDTRGEFGSTDLGVVVGTSVGPLTESGLDKAFGFAIGAGSVRASEA